jgi:hypothetical protein
MASRLIALYSPAPGCGKTTVASMLGGTRISFADPLRAMIRTMMIEAGIHPDAALRLLTIYKEMPIPELGGRSARYLLRTLGTEWGRDLIDVNIWTDIAMRKVARVKGLAVIDDLRFPNSEREAVLRAQGEVWRIDFPGREANPELFRSEGLMEDGYAWDCYIDNDGTLAQLEEQVVRARERLAIAGPS